MKLNTRLLALLLALIMLLGIFAACDEGQTETTTEAPAPSETTEAPIPEKTAFDLVVNSETTVKIIRSARVANDHPHVEAAVSLRKEIENLTGVRIDMNDDYKKSHEVYDESTLEILVGATGHSQVANAMSSLKYGDYTVQIGGNKVVIFGFTEGAIKRAVKEFMDIVENNLVKEGDSVTISIPYEQINVTGTHSGSKELSVLPYYEGATFSSTYLSNVACEQIILEDATAESYAKYIEKLESAGFTKYTDNDINGNLFTTLYNKEYTLNVGYYKHSEECRIIMEPFTENTLIGTEADNKYTAVTTSQVTMIGCEFKESDGGYSGNGLIMLFRLADGSFVIVDGGHNRSSNSSNLVKAIKEQAKDYATGKNIRIAAWFITHPHGDHDGMYRGQAASFRQFTVERVISCFISDSERERAYNSSAWDEDGVGGGASASANRTAATALGAEFITCHVGQRFYFADTVFEILYTVESYGPDPINAVNTGSLLFRAITTDPATGKSSSTMVMGDVTGPAMDICNKMYGTNMRSEVVQVAHHGYTTWGNDSAMASSYRYMSPEIVLWPQGAHAFPNYKSKSYNKVLWDGSNKNYQEMFVAGWAGSQYIVPLPYSGDPASVIAKEVKEP